MSDVGNGSRVGSGLGSVPTTGSARSGRFYFLDRAIFLVQDGGPDGIVFLIDFFFYYASCFEFLTHSFSAILKFHEPGATLKQGEYMR